MDDGEVGGIESDTTDSELEGLADMNDALKSWAVREEWASALADAPDAHEVAGAAPAAVVEEKLPLVEEVAGGHGRVKIFSDPDGSGKRWARQSVMKPGTRQESITMYCNLHKCSKCIRSHNFPSELAVRRWLMAGATLAEGRDGQAAHLRLWPSDAP